MLNSLAIFLKIGNITKCCLSLSLHRDHDTHSNTGAQIVKLVINELEAFYAIFVVLKCLVTSAHAKDIRFRQVNEIICVLIHDKVIGVIKFRERRARPRKQPSLWLEGEKS